MQTEQLCTVHHAIGAAAQEPPEPNVPIESTAIRTFKLDPMLNADIDRICKANGTTVSAFLRKCCEGLVNDYRG